MVVSNEDVLLEILLRLPVKSLVRFKLVSRHWFSLISDTKFCFNHTRINYTSSTLGIYYSTPRHKLEPAKTISLTGADHILPPLEFLRVYDSGLRILHASKGLFLCSLGHTKPFVICNVTTQKHIQLPPHLLASSFEIYNGQVPFYKRTPFLYFDPSKSLHYKVVLVGWYDGAGDYIYYNDDEREGDYSPSDGGGCYEIDIYSSESRSWKRKHLPGSGKDFYYKALCSGAIHWISRRNCHIYFEIDTEKLVVKPLILEYDFIESGMVFYFEECDGNIFLIPILKRKFYEFLILEMDRGFNWSVKYRVNIAPLAAFFGNDFLSTEGLIRYSLFSVLGVVKEDETSDFALLLAVDGKIISYGMKMGTFKVLSEFSLWRASYNEKYVSAYPFVPTLCPIQGYQNSLQPKRSMFQIIRSESLNDSDPKCSGERSRLEREDIKENRTIFKRFRFELKKRVKAWCFCGHGERGRRRYFHA